MQLTIQPVPKRFALRLRDMDLHTILLEFSGIGEEGKPPQIDLRVVVSGDKGGIVVLPWHRSPTLDRTKALADDIRVWALESYKYTQYQQLGKYGDTIMYSFNNLSVKHTEWFVRKVEEKPDITPLMLESKD